MNNYSFATAMINLPLIKESAGTTARTPEDVRRHLEDAAGLAQEAVFVLLVDAKNRVIDTVMVTLGIVNASLLHPREVFAPAIINRASAVVLVHNHPSGDLTPSAEDLKITRRLVEVGKIHDIPVMDHIIIGRKSTSNADGYYSMRENGVVNF